jgi:hypothetical protein
MTRRPAPSGPAAPAGLPVTPPVSVFRAGDVINACRSLGARFTVTVRMNASVRDAVARIGDDAWTRIEITQNALGDEDPC